MIVVNKHWIEWTLYMIQHYMYVYLTFFFNFLQVGQVVTGFGNILVRVGKKFFELLCLPCSKFKISWMPANIALWGRVIMGQLIWLNLMASNTLLDIDTQLADQWPSWGECTHFFKSEKWGENTHFFSESEQKSTTHLALILPLNSAS